MRRLTAPLALALMVTPSFAVGAEVPLCKALSALATRAAAGDVVRVQFSNAVGGDAFTACGPTDRPKVAAFCDDVVASAGTHGFHRYPWRVLDCLRAAGIRPLTITRRSMTAAGRRTVTHLTTAMTDSVRLDLAFAPEPPNASGDTWDFYGKYELVLWRP